MTYNRKFLFSLLALGFLLSCTQPPQQRAENGTVLIVVGNTDGSVGTGSGFFVERDKIATNIHVVADSGMVFAVGSKKVYNIEAVTGYDPDRDLVILKVSGKGTPLELSEGQIDEPISVVGYPGGGYKVTKGTVHGIRKSDKQLRLVAEGFPNKSNDPVVTYGNSGGPVLNSEWKVIGIAVSGVEDFSYAIDSSTSNALLDSLEEEKLSDWQKRESIRAYVYAAWGGKKLKSEDYELAIEALNKAIASYPRANDYDKRGDAKSNRRQYQEAIDDYTKALELKEDAHTYYNRGNAKLNSEDYAGAIQDYDKTLELNPDHASAYGNRGVTKADQRDYTGAIDDYTKAIELKKDYAQAYYNRGNARLNIEDYAGAIQDYTKAIKLKADPAEAYYKRGDAKRKSGDYAGAIQDYTETINRSPKNELMHAAYNNRGYTKELGQDENANLDYAKAYYYEGKANSSKGNYQVAIQYFDKSIKLKPDYATYYARGKAKQKSGDYEGAIQDYEKVIKRKPDYAEAYFQLGMTQVRLDNYAVAGNHFEKAIEKKPEFAEAHYKLGVMRHRLGNYKEAIDHFSKAIELKKPVIYAKAYKARGRVQEDLGNEAEAKKDYAKAHHAWGNEALERAEYQEAIENFDTSLESDPEFTDAYGARGETKGKLSRSKAALGDLEGAQNLYQEAIEYYDKAIDKAIKLQSENVLFYYNDRGMTKLLHGAVRDHNDRSGRIEDYEAAIDEDFTKVIEVYTMLLEDIRGHNGAMEEYQVAIEAFTKTITYFANVYRLRGMARCLLGYAKANQGRSKEAREQYKEALTDFKEAINLDPKNASHHKGLGLANAALGKAKAALEAFEEAKKKEEETETAQEAN